MHQAEEDLLVLAAQSGNQKAFNVTCKHYQSSLLHYAYKICNNQELGQDAVQEAWIKAAANLRTLNDPRAFKAWIYRLVRWKTLDLIRQSSRHQKISEACLEEGRDSLDEGIDPVCNGSTGLSSEISNELNLAMNRLPSIEKQMIHLFYLDELKISEISVILEIPSGTVKSRLNRARKLLKQKLAVNL